GDAQESADGAAARPEFASAPQPGPAEHDRSDGAARAQRRQGRGQAAARPIAADAGKPADGAPRPDGPGRRRRRHDVDARRARRHDPQAAAIARQDVPRGPGSAPQPAGPTRTARPAGPTRAAGPAEPERLRRSAEGPAGAARAAQEAPGGDEEA